ncbi:hypothetical protein ONS95_001806 [Cadophora gregata]|uniref:uncharacterized protein n=1 Tax=Cadophora gregata TaxID=51156 RepID=UPI0026DD14FB|nr:uncharacterized protein ONS95_001806 [Cadophora gregata]KAK0111447.1 hypothetical protein ONS95_001806 [Cadophora gregata]KAK0112076.1 hypothetical protein ONS96_001335 [Cadophora gregata f. sp. sojae]
MMVMASTIKLGDHVHNRYHPCHHCLLLSSCAPSFLPGTPSFPHARYQTSRLSFLLPSTTTCLNQGIGSIRRVFTTLLMKSFDCSIKLFNSFSSTPSCRFLAPASDMDKSSPTMRVTRGRTGKLPTPARRKEFVCDFNEEEDSPPPSPSRKRIKLAMEEVIDTQGVQEVVPQKKPGPVFEVFKTNKKLEDGLCVVRALGGSRYEIVNLKSVDTQQFSSEETGAIIKGNESRHNILDIGEKEWEAVKFTLGQAVRSANKAIFRIQKLPFELRLLIYSFAMVGSKPLHRYKGDTPNVALAPLMQTCKYMLEETRSVFYKNSFHINSCEKVPGDYLTIVQPHLREVTFTWDTFGRKDANAIKFFHACPDLKIFNLRVDAFLSNPRVWHRRQWSHQHVASIKKFSRCRGFDDIVELRGLEKVRVQDHGSDFTADEIKAFQDFLTPLLTAPKYVPPPKPMKVVMATKTKTKKSRKSRKSTNWEDDSDYAA